MSGEFTLIWALGMMIMPYLSGLLLPLVIMAFFRHVLGGFIGLTYALATLSIIFKYQPTNDQIVVVIALLGMINGIIFFNAGQRIKNQR